MSRFSAQDSRLIRDFRDGCIAARNEIPRSACSIQPSSVDRWAAWQAGYDFTDDDEVYSVAQPTEEKN